MNKIKKHPQIDGSLGWFETASNRHDAIGGKLNGKQAFDVVIIGAGFSGISAAQRLSEINPEMSIAVIDALDVGQGASGRNAGFIVDTPHIFDLVVGNDQHNHMIHRLNRFAIDRLNQFRLDHNIECDWQESGKYLASHEKRNLKGLKDHRSFLEESKIEYEWLEGGTLASRLGTDYYRAAIYTKDSILMNPASLIRGFAQATLKQKNITLFINSPILTIEYGKPHTLHSNKGSIEANTIINAANGHNSELYQSKNRSIPFFTYASLSEPIPEEIFNNEFRDTVPWGVTSGHAMGSTVRLTSDRRIFMRNLFRYNAHLQTDDSTLKRAISQHRDSFNARFPTLSHLDFDHSWGGMIMLTLQSKPIFTDHGNDVYTILGCNGVGITRGVFLGYYLADHINKINSTELNFIKKNGNPKHVPPNPFIQIGAQIRIQYENLMAGKDI